MFDLRNTCAYRNEFVRIIGSICFSPRVSLQRNTCIQEVRSLGEDGEVADGVPENPVAELPAPVGTERGRASQGPFSAVPKPSVGRADACVLECGDTSAATKWQRMGGGHDQLPDGCSRLRSLADTMNYCIYSKLSISSM